LSSIRELSRRLERAEGHACAMFAEARRKLFPDGGAEWMEYGGTYAVFNGIESPVTQTFGLGVFEDLNTATLDTIEKFFFDRGAAVVHEVSPFAGVAALNLLCDRQYRPVELSSVTYREAGSLPAAESMGALARVASPDETGMWIDVLTRGWVNEYPEFRDFMLESGAISAECRDSIRFLAELDGAPGAAGSLAIHEEVALFGGAATVPEMRRRGLQSALIGARMRYAFEHGCDLLMMVAGVGGESQRNAERNGFRVAYTRTKWRLAKP
jgi:GNAT superfamily N-acetyltransferase